MREEVPMTQAATATDPIKVRPETPHRVAGEHSLPRSVVAGRPEG